MPKTMILYRSPHHGNTKKLLDAIANAYPEVDLIKAGEDSFDPANYDTIGIASGVYAGQLHRTVRKALKSISGNGKKAFVIYTCGDGQGGKYGKRYESLLEKQGFASCGFYWSLGFDTFGPLKLMGGMHKDRPNTEDIQGAVEFYDGVRG